MRRSATRCTTSATRRCRRSTATTSRTQPYPVGDPIVPHQIDIVPEDAPRLPDSGDIPNGGRIFTPFWTEPRMMKPGTMGGANWPPSAYDPDSHLLYVCGTDRISNFAVRMPLETPGPNKVYMGGNFTQSSVDDAGVLAAVDVTTNKLAWRQQWREICYSGAVVTGGGLLFVGRADGRLTALDKTTGVKLWEFMTDGGVNTTVTTFEHKGKQYVVVHNLQSRWISHQARASTRRPASHAMASMDAVATVADRRCSASSMRNRSARSRPPAATTCRPSARSTT